MERAPKRLLITGASGFLGWNVCLRGRAAWQVFGVFHDHGVAMDGVTILRGDLTNYAEATDLFLRAKPDAVFHLAAASGPNFCQMHPEATRKINVDAAVHLAGMASESGIPFVFTSTDLVFDGEAAPYTEEDPVAPVSVYGEQKARAEAAILGRHPDAVICRMPLMFGKASPASECFLQPMVRALEGGREVRLFTDEYRTPLSARDAARGLFLALEKSGGGVIHLGGRERISRFDFGEVVSRVLGRGRESLTGCRRLDIPMAAARPRDVSLDSSKAFAMGFDPGQLREELKHVLVE
jgi:dTDP-4-dehydrorhamnose reductase